MSHHGHHHNPGDFDQGSGYNPTPGIGHGILGGWWPYGWGWGGGPWGWGGGPYGYRPGGGCVGLLLLAGFASWYGIDKLANRNPVADANERANKSTYGLEMVNPHALKVLREPLTSGQVHSARILTHEREGTCELVFTEPQNLRLIFKRAQGTTCEGTETAMNSSVQSNQFIQGVKARAR